MLPGELEFSNGAARECRALIQQLGLSARWVLLCPFDTTLLQDVRHTLISSLGLQAPHTQFPNEHQPLVTSASLGPKLSMGSSCPLLRVPLSQTQWWEPVLLSHQAVWASSSKLT